MGTKNPGSVLCGNEKGKLSTEPLKPGKETLPPDVKKRKKGVAALLQSRASWGLRGLIRAWEPQPAREHGRGSAGDPLGDLSLLHYLVICFGNPETFLASSFFKESNIIRGLPLLILPDCNPGSNHCQFLMDLSRDGP